MKLEMKQVSSLEKIRQSGIGDAATFWYKTVLGGESFSYQVALESKREYHIGSEFYFSVSCNELKEHIKLYSVKNVVMDLPCYTTTDEDFITKEPGMMPDLLEPLGEDGITFENVAGAVWVKIDVPEDFPAGQYCVTVTAKEVQIDTGNVLAVVSENMILNVVGTNIPKQKTIFTQWFHVDCIADMHNVPVYSEEHWDLIDKYMALAADLGVNMILTPIITPPIDTAIGRRRLCTQLVKIEKTGDKYIFDFSLLKRWIEMCNKNGIEYFEMCQLFSQWGLKYAPNIKVSENGKEDYMFGWHVSEQAEEYKDFLIQFLKELVKFLKEEKIFNRCFFHISDEPHEAYLSAYKYAYDIVKPLIEDRPIMEAISHYAFFEQGFIDVPVAHVSSIDAFIGKNIERQWAYYCSGNHVGFTDRSLSMASYRNRIIGLQMYKYNIEGFLHWGYNFYYSKLSRKKINPYLTTSGNGVYPSGNSFSVYPTDNGAAPSLRAVVFKEALMDIEICRKLESYIGREKVIELIDKEAGMDVTFSDYPRNNDYIPELMEKMKRMIKEHVKNKN